MDFGVQLMEKTVLSPSLPSHASPFITVTPNDPEFWGRVARRGRPGEGRFLRPIIFYGRTRVLPKGNKG